VGRILHLCTGDQFLHFLDAPLREQAREGLEVHLATRPGHRSRILRESGLVTVHELPFTRRMAPAEDAIALGRTLHLLRQLAPDLVHAHNPKAGLIGMVAAWLARVPARVYTVHGLPHVTSSGARRSILLTSEKTTCHLAQRVIPVSASVEAELVQHGFVRMGSMRRTGHGSADGVDAAHFRPDPGAGRALRRRLGIAEGAPVLLFVGRLHREKGLTDLAAAFQLISAALPTAELLIVGERDPTDPAPARALEKRPHVHLLGELLDTRAAYAAASLLVLPSYREGLPTVVLEAAATEVPTVAYDTLGIRDAIVDGRTGTLVPARDVVALAKACLSSLEKADERQRMGKAARAFVLEEFDPTRVRRAVLDVYAELGLEWGSQDGARG